MLTEAEFLISIIALLALIIAIVLSQLVNSKISVRNAKKEAMDRSTKSDHLIQEGRLFDNSISVGKNLKRLSEYIAKNFSDICIIYNVEGTEEEKIVSYANDKINKEHQKLMEELKRLGIKEEAMSLEKSKLSNTPFSDIISSYFTVHLIIHERFFGILCFVNTEKKISYEDIIFYTQLAEIASLSIENALLHKEKELAVKLKDEFLSTISHDLRGALHVIYGHTQLLHDEIKNQSQKKQLQSILNAAKGQEKTINAVLDTTDIISGKIKLRPYPLRLREVVSHVVLSLEKFAHKKNIEISYPIQSECIIMGVKTRVTQIIWNIIENAIRYTPSGGKIAVKTFPENENAVIEVIDTGIGIEREFIEVIKNAFEKENRLENPRIDGDGLGLTVASKLANILGGEIEVSSEGQNLGTTVKIKLPLAGLSAAHASKSQIKRQNEKTPQLNLQPYTILAVDDEDESLNILSRILRSYRANVMTSNNANQAYEIVVKERPDIIISDIAMPDMDGLELIKKIRKKEKSLGMRTPAIALTAFAQEEDKSRALKSGYDYYLAKPVFKEKLMQTITKAIA